MEILNVESMPISKSQKNNFLPEVVNRIFAICKTDPSFPLKNQIEDIDLELDAIHLRIEKQENLLEKSKELKKDLQKRITILEENNLSLQEELLEALGSEL